MKRILWEMCSRVEGVITRLQEDSARSTRRKLSALFFWALLLISVSVGLWALYHFPRWQIDELPETVLRHDSSSDIRRFELENEARKTLTNIVLGVLGLFALFLTWRRVRAGDRQVEVAEQGHLTDRFTKAIEQLGKTDDKEPNLEVRLGGIYALERVAYDSPRDHWTIMEVLTAYVRRNAPLEQLPSESMITVQNDSQQVQGKTDSNLPNKKPRTDIQAILTVLGRREQTYRREKGRKLILAETNLQGAKLREAQLQGISFQGAQLQDTYFWGAQLQGAYFRNAQMQGANFWRAQLQGAQLQGAQLAETKMQEADFWQAKMRKANFWGAQMQEANFGGAQMQEVNFWEAQMQGASFVGAQMQEANFWEAQMQGASFRGAQMQEANFGEAQMQEADLWNAQMQGANLQKAIGLTLQQLANAVLDESTKLPDYLLDKKSALLNPQQPSD